MAKNYEKLFKGAQKEFIDLWQDKFFCMVESSTLQEMSRYEFELLDLLYIAESLGFDYHKMLYAVCTAYTRVEKLLLEKGLNS